jgi:hypothetical protein
MGDSAQRDTVATGSGCTKSLSPGTTISVDALFSWNKQDLGNIPTAAMQIKDLIGVPIANLLRAW